jgi:hypothetical protein
MNEIQFSQGDYAGSYSLYAVAYSVSNGYFANGAVPEPYNAANWPLYAIVLTLDVTNSLFQGDMPAVPDDSYIVKIYEQLTATPLPSDNVLAEGEYVQQYGQAATPPTDFPSQMLIDAGAFISDFAEPITYQAYSNANVLTATYNINAVVNRSPPAAIQEDGKVLADDIEINIANDPNIGVISVNKGRDKIIVSGRYGGTAKAHVVTLLMSGDQGVWTLRCK